MNKTMKFKFWGWVSVLALGTATVGCTPLPKSSNSGATSVTSPSQSRSEVGSSSPATTKYVVGAHPGKGDMRRFYLVKSESGWNLSFAEQDLGDPGVERFLFWPAEGKVIFDFAKDRQKQVVDTIFCKGKTSQTRRSATDYSPCNSNFKVEESIILARMFVGVLTLGMSEIPPDGQRTETFKLDVQTLKSVLAQQGLDQQVSRLDYKEQYETLSSRASLNAFIDRYANNDPDSLVSQARIRLSAIDANAAAMKKAKAAVGPREKFVVQFTPGRPEKYCGAFSKDKEALSLCKAAVSYQVQELARARGAVEYRSKVCKQVSVDLQLKGVGGTCGSYAKTGQCAAKAPHEKRICDVLRMEG
ncbi:MAG: hypothetical protein U1C47_18055 [Hydrogenophaga sp.]|uniref:hypothetical protein n=1 Tax=Hydrogenophaga sp. TaxID=1904254 RepID=UPI0027351BAB|nr:hypothetical protein [Hydrogenophaga sp.]MDP3626133.1 hypothetical protein [Hydrogenophaga sp.]MDZ4293815.1 hypothetical protein [Hydrogenophaga sp.]